MRGHFLAALPTEAPGITLADLNATVKPHPSQERFREGATCGWWGKGMQLDLEAKAAIRRSDRPPVRPSKAWWKPGPAETGASRNWR